MFIEGSETARISIGNILEDMLGRVLGNLAYYNDIIISYWNNRINTALEKIVYLFMGMLAIIGFLGAAVRRPSVRGCTAAAGAHGRRVDVEPAQW